MAEEVATSSGESEGVGLVVDDLGGSDVLPERVGARGGVEGLAVVGGEVEVVEPADISLSPP